MCGCNKNKKTTLLPPPRSATWRPALAPVSSLLPDYTVTPAVLAEPAPESVPTTVWGPPLWKALHIAAHHTQYKSQMATWKMLLSALRSCLPCPECAGHYTNWHDSHPLHFSMFPTGFNNSIIVWLKDLHNSVNARLGKPFMVTQEVNVIYGGRRPEKLAEGRAALQTLQGVLGKPAYDILLSLLN